jgi:CRISPR/Cas system CSM-associated protein Csm2 small subunit
MVNVFLQNNQNHFRRVFPQLLKIFKYSKEIKVKRNAIQCIGKLIELNVAYSKIYFIEKILEPLINQSQDENKITECIEDLHQIIMGNPLIYQLYDSLNFSDSLFI